MTEFWKEVKAHRKRKVNYPSTVDGVHGDDGISEIFASKYNELYNVCLGKAANYFLCVLGTRRLLVNVSGKQVG